MKVAFYVKNSSFANIDCRSVEIGNPGIGGTWHVILIVASQLARRYNGIDVSVFVNEINDNLPKGPVYYHAMDANNAVKQADKKNFDYFVLNYSSFNWKNYDYSGLRSSIKLIPWCHNFVGRHRRGLNEFYKNSRIARVVNVGREQMELYYDHLAFSKMDYIYNCVPIDNNLIEKVYDIPFSKRGHIVTFVGSLRKAKSFHVLASIWPQIIKRVPDAELYVIGSAKLYDENTELGKYGVAENSYEKAFMKYLLDEKGRVLSSVHFMGNLGLEKFEILQKTKVGVPNPLGIGETFCISAVEMQAMGATVVAMTAPGYFDTFINGKMVSNKEQLVDIITQELLSDNPFVPYYDTINSITNKFSVDNVVNDWEILLWKSFSKHIHPLLPIRNRLYHLKWLKISLMKIKNKLPFLNKIYNIEYFYYLKSRFL